MKSPRTRYSTVAVAATFDHFHKGHEKILDYAFGVSEFVEIGLTSDEMAGRKAQSSKLKAQNYGTIESFEYRKERLERYLNERGYKGRCSIVKINDIYGTTLTKDSKIEALVVTRDTLKGARLVNKKRTELHLFPFKIVVTGFYKAEDRRRVSSTRIRNGEINRDGIVYKKLLLKNSGKISEGLRSSLKLPQGDLIMGDINNLEIAAIELKRRVLPLIIPPVSTPSAKPSVRAVGSLPSGHPGTNNFFLISIGDEVTNICNEMKIPLSLSIVDLRINRKERYKSLHEHKFSLDLKKDFITVRNPAGFITKSLINALGASINGFIVSGKRRVIRVVGEEDLAGVPAILLSPLGSLIIYGQPGEGIVLVRVNEDLKNFLCQKLEEK